MQFYETTTGIVIEIDVPPALRLDEFAIQSHQTVSTQADESSRAVALCAALKLLPSADRKAIIDRMDREGTTFAPVTYPMRGFALYLHPERAPRLVAIADANPPETVELDGEEYELAGGGGDGELVIHTRDHSVHYDERHGPFSRSLPRKPILKPDGRYAGTWEQLDGRPVMRHRDGTITNDRGQPRLATRADVERWRSQGYERE